MLPSTMGTHAFYWPAVDPGPSHLKKFLVTVYKTITAFIFETPLPQVRVTSTAVRSVLQQGMQFAISVGYPEKNNPLFSFLQERNVLPQSK